MALPTANPFLGVILHWLGGLASGSFYVPYRAVRKWAWEVYWLVGGFFSWIIAPWILALILIPHLFTILRHTPPHAIFWAFFWGFMWGIGGLTFGLTMRFLGMSLGMAIALGYCAAFGTLMPPLFNGSMGKLFTNTSGLVLMGGVLTCLIGIAFAGIAGMSKEREMPEAEKKQAIAEFNFIKGICVATFSGILSASMAYGLAAAKPMEALTINAGANPIWTGLPKLVIVLAGGFTSNFIWCVYLNIRNRTGGQYFNLIQSPESRSLTRGPIIETAVDATGEEMARVAVLEAPAATDRAPIVSNYFFSAVAGVTWYLQFFFYTMGQSKMSNYDFSSWTLHMASIIIFSSLWGIALSEWKGASRRTMTLLFASLAILIGSTIVIGLGNYLSNR